MNAITLDPSVLPGPAQRILDPSSPAPLKAMAAKGVAPGLKPQDILAVVVLLAAGTDAHAATAGETLRKLPPPLINGALASAELHPAVLDAIGPLYASDPVVAEKLLNHAALSASTVANMAALANEAVCELIATNEERLLASKAIIEKLYLNESCRMSTADRMLELAVRHGLELDIPAFVQAKKAIEGELVVEPTDEPTFDDVQFHELSHTAEELRLDESEDTHELNPATGEEQVTPRAKPLHAIWTEMRPAAKIRFLNMATLKRYDEKGKLVDEQRYDQKALRLLGVRDANPLVAVTALATPGTSDNEIIKFAAMRNVSEDVLREIAINGSWTRHYLVKLNLVANPRTPFVHALKFIPHLRENDLKALSRSRDVSGAVKVALTQQLQRSNRNS